ncbi:MAG: hypothetical protein HY282_07565 [Nitrospirae bacterium]|nr:hypothetical protein [Candidatus Manganitrophaceae bacterium]
MNTKSNRDNRVLSDAFYELSLAQPVPDAAVLDELVRRYPDYAAELTEMAIELALDALVHDETDEISSATPEEGIMVLKAMSRFHNRLYAVKAEQRGSEKTVTNREPLNPFSSLDRAGMRALGQRLHANTVFVLKLRDRLIDVETMTEGFKRRVADELKVSLDTVVAHFSGQASLAAPAHYRAEQKPVTAIKQTFEEAVRSSGFTKEQQSYLLCL